MKTAITTEFVQAVPDKLQEGVLYVSMEYATVVHKCLCGCGKEVATPLSPTDWCLTFDGDSVSLAPSIGNWSFPCRSHYWIRNNQVLWCGDMPQRLIDAGRARDRRAKAAYYGNRSVEGTAPNQVAPAVVPTESSSAAGIRGKRSLWERLTSGFS
jgi:hypothetical protein